MPAGAGRLPHRRQRRKVRERLHDRDRRTLEPEVLEQAVHLRRMQQLGAPQPARLGHPRDDFAVERRHAEVLEPAVLRCNPLLVPAAELVGRVVRQRVFVIRRDVRVPGRGAAARNDHEPLRIEAADRLGAARLADRYGRLLDLPVAVVHKTRVSGAEVAVRAITGDVRDRAPLIVDDMISTGATIAAAVAALVDAGCRPAFRVIATHGLLVSDAPQRLARLGLRRLTVTDSVLVPACPPDVPLRVVTIAPLLAEVRGYGESCDAYDVLAMEPSGEQIRRALELCLEDGSLEPGEVAYVNAHGTGTQTNDPLESGEDPSRLGTGNQIDHQRRTFELKIDFIGMTCGQIVIAGPTSLHQCPVAAGRQVERRIDSAAGPQHHLDALAAQIYVIGEVSSPGAQVMQGPMTVLQALAQAGGLKEFAKKGDIRVLRKSPTGVTSTLYFDYKAAINGSADPLPLQPGDTIVVP